MRDGVKQGRGESLSRAPSTCIRASQSAVKEEVFIHGRRYPLAKGAPKPSPLPMEGWVCEVASRTLVLEEAPAAHPYPRPEAWLHLAPAAGTAGRGGGENVEGAREKSEHAWSHTERAACAQHLKCLSSCSFMNDLQPALHTPTSSSGLGF